MIAVFIPFILFYFLLSIPALYKAHKKNELFFIDIIQPFVFVLIWLGITMLGIGDQSLSNVIEVPIILVISLIVLYVKTYIIVKSSITSKQNLYNSFFIMVVFLVAIRLFMPSLPE